MVVKQLLVGPLAVFAYVVGCEESKEALLIDPAAEVERILKQAKADGFNISLIVNTHAHPDHTGGNRRAQELTQAPIAAHPRAASSMTGLLGKAIAMMTGGEPSPPPDRLLEDGDKIEFGTVSLQVLHTPGHSKGDICLLGHGVVFTGDVLFVGGVGRTDLPGGSASQLRESIRTKLLTLPDETVVYPGHDYGVRHTSTIGEERRTNPFV